MSHLEERFVVVKSLFFDWNGNDYVSGLEVVIAEKVERGRAMRCESTKRQKETPVGENESVGLYIATSQQPADHIIPILR